MFKCVTQLTVKTSLYATVIALVNVEEPGFGEDALEEATRLLGATIRECEWASAGLLVRFICDLVNTKMVPAEHIVAFLQQLTTEFISPHVQRAETFCYLVLGALPWCAKALHTACPTSFRNLWDDLRTFFAKREAVPCGRIYLDGPGSNADALDVMWGQMLACQESEFTVAATLKPYVGFQDDLFPGNVSRGWLRDFHLPPHEDTFVYWDKPAALHLFYGWDDKAGRQQDMAPEEVKRREDALKEDTRGMTHFLNRFKIRPVDRLVVALYASDTLYFWNTSREDCVKKLRLLPIKGQPEHLVVETILSHLLMVPQSTFSPVYYASIMVDLCKLDFKYPVILAEAVDGLYDLLPSMDNEVVERFASFLAFVVSNFGYKWIWEEWTAVLENDNLKEGTCKKLFIYEVFSGLLRLSYRERLLDVIPAAFHKFIPDAPRHAFKWDLKRWKGKTPPPFKAVAEEVYNAIASGQYDSAEVMLEMHRADWNEEMGPADKIELLIHCLLVNGLETVSHQRKMLEKFKPALEGVINDADRGGEPSVDPTLRLRMVQACCAFWDNSPQHKLIAINQLLTLQLVEPVNVIHWLFSPGVKTYWERAYTWEVARLAIDALIEEILEMLRQLRQVHRDRLRLERELNEEPDAPDFADKTKAIKKLERKARQTEGLLRSDLVEHLKLVFFELFKGFKEVLTQHYRRTDGEGAKPLEKLPRDQLVKVERGRAKDYVWHKSAVSHFAEMGRKYLMWLLPWLPELKATFFHERDTDPRILAVVNGWEGMKCRRWCPAKGYSPAQANPSLRFFFEMAKQSGED